MEKPRGVGGPNDTNEDGVGDDSPRLVQSLVNPSIMASHSMIDTRPETLDALNGSLSKVDKDIRTAEQRIRDAQETVTRMQEAIAQTEIIKRGLVAIYHSKFSDQAYAEALPVNADRTPWSGINLDFFQPERLKVLGPEELRQYNRWRLGYLFARIQRDYGDQYEFPDKDYTDKLYGLPKILEQRRLSPYPMEMLPKELRGRRSDFIFIPPDFEDRPFPDEREKNIEDPTFVSPHRGEGLAAPDYQVFGWINDYVFQLGRGMLPTLNAEKDRIVLLKKKK